MSSLIDHLVSLLTTSPERWTDVQTDVVDAAAVGDSDERGRLARALVDAIATDARYGPENPLTPAAFDLILVNASRELEDLLARVAVERPVATGARFVREHLWSVPGPQGAVWLARLAAGDPIRVSFMYQDMATGALPRWADDDWPGSTRLTSRWIATRRSCASSRLRGRRRPPVPRSSGSRPGSAATNAIPSFAASSAACGAGGPEMPPPMRGCSTGKRAMPTANCSVGSSSSRATLAIVRRSSLSCRWDRTLRS